MIKPLPWQGLLLTQFQPPNSSVLDLSPVAVMLQVTRPSSQENLRKGAAKIPQLKHYTGAVKGRDIHLFSKKEGWKIGGEGKMKDVI